MPLTGVDAAIRELEGEVKRIQDAIQTLRSFDRGSANGAGPKLGRPSGRRKMSADARRRIAEAQRKRWAAVKGSKAAKAKAAKAKAA